MFPPSGVALRVVLLMLAMVAPGAAKFPRDPECGQTKGCYSDCKADGCSFLLSWAAGASADDIAITMKALVTNPAGRYIAFGLSDDMLMGDDSVTFCTSTQADGVFNGYNARRSNSLLAQPQEGLSNIATSYTDGVKQCTFTRLKAADNDNKRFALDTDYIIFFVHGPWSETQKIALQHDREKEISPRAISLVNFTEDVGYDPTPAPQPTTQSPDQPPAQAGKVTRDPDCGLSKGCFSDCEGEECSYLISWRAGGSPDTVAVTMSGVVTQETGQYIALGLSKDDQMGDDSVVYCINAPDGVFLSHNVAGDKNNVLNDNPKDGLSDIDVRYNDGVLTCSFTRDKTADASGQRFSLDGDYKLLYATGPGSERGTEYHDKKLVSTQTASLVNFAVNIGSSSEDYPFVKAHGSLMIVAWIFAASIGLVFARYFKDVWEDSTWGGQKIWFQIHRACMVTAFLATATGFVVIFVDVGGYSDIRGEWYKKAHPILGIIVTVLTVINPVMALFRPHPGTSKRPIFNWAHWLVGSGAHILGVITIFLGVLLNKAGAPQYIIYILAAYVGWQVLIQILMEIAQCIGRGPSDSSETYELTSINDRGRSAASPKKQATFNKRLLVYLHILIIIGFAVALITILNIGKD